MPQLDTAAKADVAKELMAGVPQTVIAKTQGVSQPTISKFKKQIIKCFLNIFGKSFYRIQRFSRQARL